MKVTKSKRIAFVVSAVAVLGVVGVAEPAGAATDTVSIVNSGEARAVAKYQGFASKIASSGDVDLVKFLLMGTGPITKQYPGLAVEVGFPEVRPTLDPAEAAVVAKTFLDRYPNFSTRWAPAIKSGDLIKIDNAMGEFIVAIAAFVQTDSLFTGQRKGAAQKTLRGANDSVWLWNAAVAVNAAAGVTTFVAGATVAVVTMAVLVWVGAVYLSDAGGTVSRIDMQNMRGRIASALAS